MTDASGSPRLLVLAYHRIASEGPASLQQWRLTPATLAAALMIRAGPIRSNTKARYRAAERMLHQATTSFPQRKATNCTVSSRTGRIGQRVNREPELHRHNLTNGPEGVGRESVSPGSQRAPPKFMPRCGL